MDSCVSPNNLPPRQKILRNTSAVAIVSLIYFANYWLLLQLVPGITTWFSVNRAFQFFMLGWVCLLYVKTFRRHRTILILAVLSVVVHFSLLIKREEVFYTYDKTMHYENIIHYATHMTIPPADGPGESSQPPAYYYAAGLVYRVATLLANGQDVWPAVVSLNFFFFMVFLLYGVLALMHVIRHPFLLFLGATAILFWPANILHCSRVGNDILQYLAFAACSYHFAQWYRYSRPAQLNAALVWLAVSFATKNSVVVLVLMLALLGFKKVFWGKTVAEGVGVIKSLSYARHIKPFRIALLLLLLGASLSFGRNLVNVFHEGNFALVGGMIHKGKTFVFRPEQLLFDVEAYLSHPYFYHPEGKDKNTLHVILRSLSFGENKWNGTAQAIALNGLLLSLWCFFMGSLLYYGIRHRSLPRMVGFYTTFFFCCVIALYMAKIYFWGIPIWADTRHLYPLMIYFVLAYVGILQDCSKKNRTLYRLGSGLLFAYVYTSILHGSMQMLVMVKSL